VFSIERHYRQRPAYGAFPINLELEAALLLRARGSFPSPPAYILIANWPG